MVYKINKNIIIFLAFALSVALGFFIKYIFDTKNSMRELNYITVSNSIKKSLLSNINTTQTTSMSKALEYAGDYMLVHSVLESTQDKSIYQGIFTKDSLKKIGKIRVYDSYLKTLYKNWSDNLESDFGLYRGDIEYVLKTKTPINTISSDEYSFSLKSIVPIMLQDRVVGFLEISNDFSSISKELKNQDIDSVVLLNKKYSNELLKPETNIFLDEYYVANFDVLNANMSYIKHYGVDEILRANRLVNGEYLVDTIGLKDFRNNIIGYYVMLKDLKSISSENIDDFLLKLALIGAVSFLVLVIIVLYIMLDYNREQKNFYKDMIHKSPNIAIIASKEEILEVNDTFFQYFSDFKTLDEFKKSHKTISEFFAAEGGYMCKDSEDFCWIELIMQNMQESKVKLVLGESFYYFNISVSVISRDKGLFYAVFRDITKEELYKKELENTNITDALTKVKNRYFYNLALEKEMLSANRYFYPLSLIVFDIDYFKKINDNYGHDVGDRVLVEYANLVNLHIRDSDIFCRIGGEEFAIILPHATKAGAYKLADKLRVLVMEHKEIVPITMSFGVVEYKKGEGVDFTFKRADEALYVSKQNGRNRVSVR